MTKLAYGAKEFVREVDAADAKEAIAVATAGMGEEDATLIQEGPTVVLTMLEAPEPGQTDNVKGNTSDAYLFASITRYDIPSDDYVNKDGEWSMEASGDLEAAADPLGEVPFCVAIDCGIPTWEVTTYKRVPKTKATAKFHLRYVVEADGRDVADFDKVSEAKAFAKDIIADPSCAHLHVAPEVISIRRKPVSDGGDDLAIGYRKHVRTTKTRPAKVTDGATVKATHHWLVYGSYIEAGYRHLHAMEKKYTVKKSK